MISANVNQSEPRILYLIRVLYNRPLVDRVGSTKRENACYAG